MKNKPPIFTMAALAAAAAGQTENFIAASTPGGIEAQEVAGQIAFVANETLPKDGIECVKAMGVKVLDAADDLFVNVQLPDGWRKKPTDHSMWSELLDDKGVKRAAIFYKAAFYDRSAFIRPA